jgi:hypothetical protein
MTDEAREKRLYCPGAFIGLLAQWINSQLNRAKAKYLKVFNYLNFFTA